MNCADISDSAFCAGLACATDLPDVIYQRKIHKKGVPWHELPTEEATRRPMADEINVYSFPQTWGSTALGFGGIGGAAMTTAQTTVVEFHRTFAVYFGKRLAYVVQNPVQVFMDDLWRMNLAPCSGKDKYSHTGAKK